MTINVEHFGLFAGKDEAIKQLKADMAYMFQQQDRRNQLRSLYFNEFWTNKDEIITKAMLAFFQVSSAERAIVETAITGMDEAVKIQAVLIGLLAMALSQNSSTLDKKHVSDSLIDRSKVVEKIIQGLIHEKFGDNSSLAESLLPLAKYSQAACNTARNSHATTVEPVISSQRPVLA